MLAEESDIGIARKAQAGDRSAFERLVRKYQGKVLRLCCSFLGKDSAEDAAQEIFIKVFESLDQFKAMSAFSTWLYRIASNHCLNILAKRKREKTESLDAIQSRSGDHARQFADKSDLATAAENREYLTSLLSQLAPDHKTVLILREVNGLNYRELADTLDISMDAVKVRLFRARKALLQAAQKRA